MQNQLFVKHYLISHNVVANPSQFITQGSGGNDRVRLGRLSIMVSAKSLVVSA
jgi:hypothetical protein